MRRLCALLVVVVLASLGLHYLNKEIRSARSPQSQAMRAWHEAENCKAGKDDEGALKHFQEAVEIAHRHKLPVIWSYAQHNLGMTYQRLAARTVPPGEPMLREAVLAYRAALEVHTLDWVRVQYALGFVLEQLADQETGAAQRDLWLEAEKAYEATVDAWSQPDSVYVRHLLEENLKKVREKLGR